MALLQADEGMSDPQIMAELEVGRPTVERIRKNICVSRVGKTVSLVLCMGKVGIQSSSSPRPK
jgi:hypothetical protein